MKISIEQKGMPTVKHSTLNAGDLFINYKESTTIYMKTDEHNSVALFDGEICDDYTPDYLVTNVTDQFELTRTAECLE
jgi:hypothetical protein